MKESSHSNQLGRFARGELAAPEARELAQEALDSPELFEGLTDLAIVNRALASRSRAEAKIVGFPLRNRAVISGIAAAATVFLAICLLRPTWSPGLGSTKQANAKPFGSRIHPVVSASGNSGQPILLSALLTPQIAIAHNARIFRGGESSTRLPQPVGAIVSLEGLTASINLGSLDGIVNGTGLQIYRPPASSRPIGELIVTTVFRERARGQVTGTEKIQRGDEVRIPDALSVQTLLERADVLESQGDSTGARKLAGQAAARAETANLPASQRASILERLGAMEYRGARLDLAETYFRSAVQLFESDARALVTEKITALNGLAVLFVLKSDYQKAQSALHRAASLSGTGRPNAQTLNNLGVLAELNGQTQNAQRLYENALRAFPSSTPEQDRRAAEMNLARARGSH